MLKNTRGPRLLALLITALAVVRADEEQAAAGRPETPGAGAAGAASLDRHSEKPGRPGGAMLQTRRSLPTENMMFEDRAEAPIPRKGEALIQTQRSLAIEAVTLKDYVAEDDVEAADSNCASPAAGDLDRAWRGGVFMESETRRSPLGHAASGLEDPFGALEDRFDQGSPGKGSTVGARSKEVTFGASIAFLLELAVGAIAAKGILSWRSQEQKPLPQRAAVLVKPPQKAKTEDAAGWEDAWGCTALHVAADLNALSEATALLERRADINAREAWDETPLHFAARSGSAEICGLLLERGAMIDAPNSDGWTPLVTAADAGSQETVDVLLAHGAGVGGVSDTELPPMLTAALACRMIAGGPRRAAGPSDFEGDQEILSAIAAEHEQALSEW